jgi:hypothetical protein
MTMHASTQTHTHALRQIAIILIAACAHINCATAQNSTQKEPKTACTTTKDIKAPQLYGTWHVTFTNPPLGLTVGATLLLEKHGEFSDSLQGVVTRKLPTAEKAATGHAAKAALAGDVEDGFVILDESSNNTSISGTWNGQLVDGSCGREVKGVWKDVSTNAAPDAPDVPFTMKKLSGW